MTPLGNDVEYVLHPSVFYRLAGDKVVLHCTYTSLYSHVAERHDAVTRVDGSFEGTVRAIRNCRLAGIPSKIKMPVFEETSSDVAGVIALARTLGASVAVSDNITPKKNGDTSPISMRVASAAIREDVARLIDEQLGDLAMEGSSDTGSNRICSAGARMVSVNPYGDVFPCVCFPLRLGNVRETGIAEIWDHSDELEWWRRHNMAEKRTECSGCACVSHCRFCPGEALLYSGSPLSRYQDACLVAGRAGQAS